MCRTCFKYEPFLVGAQGLQVFCFALLYLSSFDNHSNPVREARLRDGDNDSANPNLELGS